MDTSNEQRQVATGIEELENRLSRLSPRLAQLVEELSDVQGQVRGALTGVACEKVNYPTLRFCLAP